MLGGSYWPLSVIPAYSLFATVRLKRLTIHLTNRLALYQFRNVLVLIFLNQHTDDFHQ